MNKRLLIIVSERISEWIKKGELISRYYNPENFFDEVHVLLTNQDNPDLQLVQILVGNAKLFIYNYPEPDKFFTKTLCWQPFFIKRWIIDGVELIQKINPNLIRCYGAHLNSYIAAFAKKMLGKPYLVSLHTDPDENLRKSAKTLKNKIIFRALKKIEKVGLKNADLVLPVYEPIIPYLKKLGVLHYKVCYNVLNDINLLRKTNYLLSSPVRCVSVGRQFDEKNPSHLISALKFFDNLEITFVGDGDCHEHLKDHARQEGVFSRTHFIKAIMNDELCKSLSSYDFFAIHTQCFEISKVVLESFLVGLPVLLNYREGNQVPELNDEICLRVKNTVEGYRLGLHKLIQDREYRENLGRRSYTIAKEKWAPELCERNYASIYKKYVLN